MPSHEARINDALKQLGEEFRLGMVQVAEYRARRKAIIDGWGEHEVTTAPRRSQTATGQAPRPRPVAPPSPPRKSRTPLIIAGAALIALVAVGWFVLGRSSAPRGSASQPGAEPLSESAMAVRAAADEFVARNVWDRESIQAFLAQWQALSPPDRARLQQESAMRTLRYRLDQNIQAEMQLITPDTKPEQRTQLTLLQDFSRALAGNGQ